MRISIWDELTEEQRDRVRKLREDVLEAFHGMQTPKQFESLAVIGDSAHPEINEIDHILWKDTWESIDREGLRQALKSGLAVVNLCRDELLPFIIPMLMSIVLTEGVLDDQNDIYMEQVLKRLIGGKRIPKMSLNVFTPSQKKVVKDFIKLGVEIFGLPE
ncbi:hypothetical protein [Schlesneria sp. DSM 10557]|uniref:hypothetical protein n=1 Tax=Schlesneria sp. DSM 10557 TaxID=3044399 RepID=UPI00359FC8F4